jgi:hypothetical protein
MVLTHRVVRRALAMVIRVFSGHVEASFRRAPLSMERKLLPICAHGQPGATVYKATFHCDDGVLLLPSFSAITTLSDLFSWNLVSVSSIFSEKILHPSTSCLQPLLLHPAVSPASLYSVTHLLCRRCCCGRLRPVVLSGTNLSQFAPSPPGFNLPTLSIDTCGNPRTKLRTLLVKARASATMLFSMSSMPF